MARERVERRNNRGRVGEQLVARSLVVSTPIVAFCKTARADCPIGPRDRASLASARDLLLVAPLMVDVPPESDAPLSPYGGMSAITTFAALAERCGASAIARDARVLDPGDSRAEPELRRLHLRLHLHLQDQRRGLDSSVEELELQLAAIEDCLGASRRLLESRATGLDEARENLERALEAERTRFLMSTRADAFGELLERLEAESTAMQLRSLAHRVASEIATSAITRWQQRIRQIVDTVVGNAGRTFSERVRAGFESHADRVPAVALWSVAVVVTPAPVEVAFPPSPGGGVLTRLRDRVHGAGSLRRKAEELGMTALRWSLETSSRLIVDESLACFDVATRELESSLIARFEQLAETARGCVTRTRDARAGGPHAIRWEYERIDAWIAQLG